MAGKVPSGTYHRLACARHLRDRQREGTSAFPYVFDPRRAKRPVDFCSHLKHYKGEWAGQFLVLELWQQFIVGSMFGWVHRQTGLRRFRKAYNEIPRKSGKTFLAAGVVLYATFFDGEPGAEGYTAAMKKDQARIVFEDAKRLVRQSSLKQRIAIHARNLHQTETACKLEPLSADYDSMDGLNVHVAVIDEWHAQKDRGIVDVIETSMGSRRQPILFGITTAGDDPVSPCGDEHDYACKVLDGVIQDETLFAFIAHAEEHDDPFAEATWKRANPNYGISVKRDDMRALAHKARHMPSALAAFKQKRLNIWVNATAPCLSMEGWRTGQHSDWTPADLAHQTCYVGIDLASKLDLCAVSLAFPPTDQRQSWRLLQHIWTPAETLAERAHRDRAPYHVWVDQGWLTATPGTRINHQVVRDVLRHARQQYEIEYIGYDEWHADMLIDQLIDEDGFTREQVLPVAQTYAGMSSACLHLQAEILDGRVDARGCPVTAWAVSNAVGQRDGKDNLMLAKGRSRGRIDPIIAPTIAMAHWLRFSRVSVASRRVRRAPRIWTPSGWVSAGDHASA